MGLAGSAHDHAVQGRPRDSDLLDPDNHDLSNRGNGDLPDPGDRDLLDQLVAAVGRWARPRLAAVPWSSGMGLARTVLALGTTATLAATAADVLVAYPAGSGRPAVCTGPNAAGLFCAVPTWHGELARWCAVAVLLLVASGWRPRVTAIAHWYVAWSLVANGAVIDGGDQLTAILTLLLIPVGLTDSRRWHWQRSTSDELGAARAVAYAGLLLIQLQMAVVYFQSSVAKLGVREWADGTAMYYFFQHPLFGAPSWLRPLTDAATGSPAGVALVTWSPIVIEFALAMAILLGPPARRMLLVVGLAFHAVIALCMGLVSFDLAMSGGLLLYLLPVGHQLRFTTRDPAVPRTAALAVGQVADTPRLEPAR